MFFLNISIMLQNYSRLTLLTPFQLFDSPPMLITRLIYELTMLPI